MSDRYAVNLYFRAPNKRILKEAIIEAGKEMESVILLDDFIDIIELKGEDDY